MLVANDMNDLVCHPSQVNETNPGEPNSNKLESIGNHAGTLVGDSSDTSIGSKDPIALLESKQKAANIEGN